MMQFRGHNGCYPCRWCDVAAVPYVREVPLILPQKSATESTSASTSAPPTSSSIAPLSSTPIGEQIAAAPPVKKSRRTTTYYVARKPHDIPTSLIDPNTVLNIKYDQLPLRTDAGVKEKVSYVTDPSVSQAERDRRATASGIGGNVS
jgi:hypothetical protein